MDVEIDVRVNLGKFVSLTSSWLPACVKEGSDGPAMDQFWIVLPSKLSPTFALT